MIEPLISATSSLLSGASPLYLMLGIIVGLIFGAIPGLGGTTAIALLIPLTYGMESDEAIILIGGVMGAVMFGGSISAILLNTPGVAPNAATAFDGYPLAKQGKAGLAIGAAATASAVGGLLGVVILVMVLPIAKLIVLSFGPPEFFLLALLGLCSIAVSTGGLLLRGLIAGGIGFGLALVGFDDVSGGVRFTGGIEYLWDGVPLVPMLIGLFAIAEMIKLSTEGGSVATDTSGVRITRVMDGVWATFRNWPTVLRGSTIGVFIGCVPGVGGTIASFLSYSVTAQVSKDSETFGKGNIKGVIAPEAANNAKDGGALIPTLAFGVPGSAEMAVFLGVLVLHGLDPGPMLLLEHESTIFTLILALAASTVIASLIGLAIARQLVLITLVNVNILIPVVVSVGLVGAYALHNAIGDVIMAALFGVVGYLMMRFDYPRITVVIALVLGELAERSFHQSMAISDGQLAVFFTRQVSLILVLMVVFALCWPVFRYIYTHRRGLDAKS